MAEARAEEDEERLREPGARRSTEHSDRNKPDQRNSSQGPLSSIRAAIKRTSTRPSSQSDHHRDRRRPEITILSAEPLPSNSWFPGASGAFPPAPPPAPPSWSGCPTTVQLPPPSYEQVIREKSREQSLRSASSSSSSPSSHSPKSTIATQTDTDSPGSQAPAARPVRRPPKPPRPSLPLKPTSEPLIQLDRSDPPGDAEPLTQTRNALSKPPSEQCAVQTDFDDIITDSPRDLTATASPQDKPHLQDPKPCPRPHPKPRPRSKVVLQPLVNDQPMTREVKVQTLVRLKDDGTESIFAGFDDSSTNISSKYLQDLLDVFGPDETHLQQQNEPSDEEEDAPSEVAVISMVTAKPEEPLNRPKPRPRTQKPKSLLSPTQPDPENTPDSEQNPAKQTSSPPVPAPRPLLSKHQNPASPEPTARPDEHQISAVTSRLSDRRNSDDQEVMSPSETSMTETAETSADRNILKRPSVPKHIRPPPPVHRKMSSTSQVVGATVNVSRSTDGSVPPLPPRPSGGRLLPLRPPPIKMNKPTGPSSSSPAATNQPPGGRVPKKGPPLPPRPKPGHPLYKSYTREVLQGTSEVEDAGKEQEEPSFQDEEQLIILDDTNIPQTQNPVHELSWTEELRDISGPGQTETTSQKHTQSRCLARFAFEGEEGELTFGEGDVITLIEYVNEEWGRGRLNGRTGSFPLNFVEVSEDTDALPRKPAVQSSAPPTGSREKNRGTALFDFSPENEDELCLKAGDVLCNLEEMDDEWFLGEFGGKRGIVPKNYIQILAEP